MPALQVKDFPPDLYEELRVCAAEDDRSMSQQTVHVLREYLRARRRIGDRPGWVVCPVKPEPPVERRRTKDEEREARIEHRRKVFERIHALPKIEIPADFPEPAELVRQMREERDDQIVPELRHIR